MSEGNVVRVGAGVYGGSFLTSEYGVTLPFVVPQETVKLSASVNVLRVIEPSVERIEPRCPHFGTCGGCQYQMMTGREQLRVKRGILRDQLQGAGVVTPVEIEAAGGEEYGYRNRIRLRLERVDGELRFGYNMRTTTEFLPITTCPIAAPILWATAEKLLTSANTQDDVAFWMNAASEVELFANDDLTRLQVTMLCAPRTKAKQGSLQRCLTALQQSVAEVVGLSAIASDPRTGPTGRTLDAAGAAGLNYRVLDETYWISRGGFFQVNRFLLPALVKTVCDGRSGDVAWDLFAGVGLFSRVLAKSFAQVTAVEANPIAAGDLQVALKKLGAQHRAVQASTLEFLQKALVQRERPALVVLDPPRAGAGREACELLLSLDAREIVYVSCDPATLAQDLAVLQQGYRIASLKLVDLFPQTFHMETIVVLERKG
jgi:23S rRNA (uracil1939-C5)-methyltransferase